MTSKLNVKHDTMDLSKVPRHHDHESTKFNHQTNTEVYNQAQPTTQPTLASVGGRRIISKYGDRPRHSFTPDLSSLAATLPQNTNSSLSTSLPPPSLSTQSTEQDNSTTVPTNNNIAPLPAQSHILSTPLPPPQLSQQYFIEQFSLHNTQQQQLLQRQQAFSNTSADFKTQIQHQRNNLNQSDILLSSLINDTNLFLNRILSLHSKSFPTSSSSFSKTETHSEHSISLPQSYLDSLKLSIDAIQDIINTPNPRKHVQLENEDSFSILTTPIKQSAITSDANNIINNNDTNDNDISFDLNDLQDQCKVGFSPNRHRTSPSIPLQSQPQQEITQDPSDSLPTTSPLKIMNTRPMITNRFRKSSATLTSPITAQFLESNSNQQTEQPVLPPVFIAPTSNQNDDSEDDLFGDEDACLVFKAKPTATFIPPQPVKPQLDHNNDESDENLFDDEDACLVIKPKATSTPPPAPSNNHYDQDDDENLFDDEDACLVIKPKIPTAPHIDSRPPPGQLSDDDDLFGDEDACLVVKTRPSTDPSMISTDSSSLMVSGHYSTPFEGYQHHDHDQGNNTENVFDELGSYDSYVYRIKNPPDLRYDATCDEFLDAAEYYATNFTPQVFFLSISSSDHEIDTQEDEQTDANSQEETKDILPPSVDFSNFSDPNYSSNSNGNPITPIEGLQSAFKNIKKLSRQSKNRKLRWSRPPTPPLEALEVPEGTPIPKLMDITVLEFEPQEYEDIPYIRDHVEAVDGEIPIELQIEIPDDYYDSDQDTPDSAPTVSTFHYFEATQQNTNRNTSSKLSHDRVNSLWDCTYQRRYPPASFDESSFYAVQEEGDSHDPYGQGFSPFYRQHADNGEESPHSSDEEYNQQYWHTPQPETYIIEPVPPDDDDGEAPEQMRERLSKYFAPTK